MRRSLRSQASPMAGYVSISLAEERWAEREAAFAHQIEQLLALVAAPSDGSGAAEAASVASDTVSVADLEDDEAWSKVAKSSRRALLRRQRDELASKVRSKLGKTASERSPFQKRPDLLGR